MFNSVSPARLAATNTGQGICTPSPCARLTAGGSTTIQATGQAGIPATGVSAVALMVHALIPDSAGIFAITSPGVNATPGSPGVPMSFDTGLTSDLVIVPIGASGQLTVSTSTGTDVSVEVVGWYTPPESGQGLTATAITPQTIARTDWAYGTCLPSPCAGLMANVPKRIKVTGVGDIPANAEAVAMVIHAFYLPAYALGYLSAWKSDPADPNPQPAGADITWFGEAGLSGTVIVPVDANGYITVLASTDAQIAIEAVGYYQAATKTYTYTYAPDGLRTTKTAPDGTVTRFTWDRSGALPLLLAEAIDAPGTSNDRTVRYIYGPGAIVVADVTTPSGGTDTVRLYHHDQLGTTRALTDPAGNIIGSYAYTPYGELTSQTGTATTPIGWAGEYRDSETGLMYLRARYYDPATGQFLARDPVTSATRSAYAYVSGNPLNANDPLGLSECGLSFGGVVDCLSRLDDLSGEDVIGFVKDVSGSIQLGADIVTVGAALVPGGQGVAAVAYVTANAAGAVNVGATCVEAAAYGGSVGDCIRSAAINAGTAGLGRLFGAVPKGVSLMEQYTVRQLRGRGLLELLGDVFELDGADDCVRGQGNW